MSSDMSRVRILPLRYNSWFSSQSLYAVLRPHRGRPQTALRQHGGKPDSRTRMLRGDDPFQSYSSRLNKSGASSYCTTSRCPAIADFIAPHCSTAASPAATRAFARHSHAVDKRYLTSFMFTGLPSTPRIGALDIPFTSGSPVLINT